MEESKGRLGISLEKAKSNMYLYLLKKILLMPYGRELVFKKFDKKLYKGIVEDNTESPKAVQERKYYFLKSMLTCAKRNIDKGWFSKEVAEKVVNTLVKFGFANTGEYHKEEIGKFEQKYGRKPPSFVVLSPTQKCNLKCAGCYASSKMNCPSLPYETVKKIVDETYNEWGNRFMTISGGEPLIYEDNGKTLFNVWEDHPEMFFLFYTNGTLINKEVAEKLAKLGNVTPAISVEGWEKQTDERRGKGVFQKIKQATDNLKEAGVPFGASITATSQNINTLLDEKFYDFLFQELGATYVWMFQLMPIGQAKDMKELMITPEQRVKLFRMWEKMLKEKNYCIADFWNSGVLSDGCIAYGRNGGYLYVDWNGNIMPCVFVPYYEQNIMDLHKQGKKLADSLFSDLFKNGRKWQEEYGLSCKKSPNNWLMPCSIRDHWDNFKTNILSKNSKPEDEFAAEAIKSEEYTEVLNEFDEKLEKQTKPIWEKEYLDKKT